MSSIAHGLGQVFVCVCFCCLRGHLNFWNLVVGSTIIRRLLKGHRLLTIILGPMFLYVRLYQISELLLVFICLSRAKTVYTLKHLLSASCIYYGLYGSFILLKLLFSKFTMTSSLRWIVLRSPHFFSTYLLHSILLIIPSFQLVFKIGLVLMVYLLIGSHLISHLALKQSQSMNPLLHFLFFPLVYPKFPYLVHSFSLSIQLLLTWWSQSLKYHLYAEDTQLYISFTPTNSALSLETLTTTFTDILSWMNLNKLLLNPSKTEFLLIGTKQQRLKFSDLTSLSLRNDIIPVSSSARNLGFIFVSDMFFSDQINSVSKSCHFHIRDIRWICHLLPLSTATALANSLVSSKLDYCNSLYLASHKEILTDYNAFKIHWHVSLQTLQNINILHHYSKTYTGFQSNKESITNSVFSQTKH